MIKTNTVAIPVFNGEKFIKDAIVSIFEQTANVDEILIIDNHSTDRTIEKVNKVIKNNLEKNIKLIKNKENFGYQKNWNKCFEYCKTKYLIILHHDDMLKTDCIEKQLELFRTKTDLALVGGQEDNIDKSGNIILKRVPVNTQIFNKGDILKFIKETGSYIPCSSVMFNMSKIREVGFFQENVLAADELYWPKVLFKFPVALLGESLINRRIHVGQTEYHDFKYKKKEEVEWATHFLKILEYEKRGKKKEMLSKLLKKKIAYSYLNISQNVIKYHRSFRLFLYYIYYSIKYYPIIIVKPSFWKGIVKSVLVYFKFPYLFKAE